MKPLVTLVVGARPNFMKASALVAPLRRAGLRVRLVHTGQHYDPAMSGRLFRELGLPRPDAHLGAGSGTHAAQTARILARFDRDLAACPPRLVLVVGDVNSTLAAALAAAKRRIPVAHVEAGLRSGDRRMPEEVNRVVTDHLSDLLFTTLPEDDAVLRREGIPAARIFRVGNVMSDTLLACRARARRAAAPLRRTLGLRGPYGLVTLHRTENVDDPRRLERLLEALGRVAVRLPLVFPVHPRTQPRLRGRRLPAGVLPVEPLGYLAFTGLLQGAALMLTDSGGVQHEAALLGVPCLTLRDTTEWGVTCRSGANRLVGTDPGRIAREAERALARPRRAARPPLWDGRVGARVARAVAAFLKRRP